MEEGMQLAQLMASLGKWVAVSPARHTRTFSVLMRSATEEWGSSFLVWPKNCPVQERPALKRQYSFPSFSDPVETLCGRTASNPWACRSRRVQLWKEGTSQPRNRGTVCKFWHSRQWLAKGRPVVDEREQLTCPVSSWPGLACEGQLWRMGMQLPWTDSPGHVCPCGVQPHKKRHSVHDLALSISYPALKGSAMEMGVQLPWTYTSNPVWTCRSQK